MKPTRNNKQDIEIATQGEQIKNIKERLNRFLDNDWIHHCKKVDKIIWYGLTIAGSIILLLLGILLKAFI